MEQSKNVNYSSLNTNQFEETIKFIHSLIHLFIHFKDLCWLVLKLRSKRRAGHTMVHKLNPYSLLVILKAQSVALFSSHHFFSPRVIFLSRADASQMPPAPPALDCFPDISIKMT